MDGQRAECKLPRFHDQSPKELKKKRLSLLSASGHDNCDDAYNASAVPAIRNVAVRDGTKYCFDSGAEKCEGKKMLHEDNKALNDE